MKNFIQAVKENRDNIRGHLGALATVVVASVVSSVYLTKKAQEDVSVIVIQEVIPEADNSSAI